MTRCSRARLIVVLGATLAAVWSAHDARAQPVRRKPVTPADIDRIEKKIDEQQRLLQALIALQKQYLRALADLAPSAAPVEPVAGVEPKPRVDRVEPRPVASVEPRPRVERVEPRPQVAPKPELAEDPSPPVPAPDPNPIGKPATDPGARLVRVVRPPVKPRPEVSTALGSVVGRVTGAPDAIVYIEDIHASPVRRAATMKQQGKQFVPRVLVVEKGTQVAFPNLDALFHNVFSVTPDNSFDLGSYRQGESKSVAMTKPGVVSVYCNMHPQMVGYVLVVPNTHHVGVGKDGFFRLSGVPVGRHRIVAWAPNAKPVVSEVEVVESEAVTTEFALKKSRAAAHTNKDGLPYSSYNE